MTRLRFLSLALLLLAVVAAACGDDTDADSSATDDTSSDNTASSTTTVVDDPGAVETATKPEFPTPEVSTVAELLALDRPIVAGHAGGDQSWPHSTMFAFTEAAVAGVDVLEMDVQLTGDGTLVVQHDDTVDRTTETTGAVRDLTYDQLQSLDNGYWWSEEWSSHDLADDAYVYRGVRTGDVAPPDGYGPDDFRVETFRSVAEAFPDHVLDVEIKIPDGDDGEADLEFAIEGARILAAEIADLGRTDSVVVVSFDDDVMEAFRGFAPDVTTSPGTGAMTNWILAGDDLPPSDLVLQLPPFFDEIEVLTPEVIAKAADKGLAIWAWPNDASTQENADFYQELVERGIDGIIAGRPADAVERFATLN